MRLIPNKYENTRKVLLLFGGGCLLRYGNSRFERITLAIRNFCGLLVRVFPYYYLSFYSPLTVLGLWSGADFETQNFKICTEDY